MWSCRSICTSGVNSLVCVKVTVISRAAQASRPQIHPRRLSIEDFYRISVGRCKGARHTSAHPALSGTISVSSVYLDKYLRKWMTHAAKLGSKWQHRGSRVKRMLSPRPASAAVTRIRLPPLKSTGRSRGYSIKARGRGIGQPENGGLDVGHTIPGGRNRRASASDLDGDSLRARQQAVYWRQYFSMGARLK